jgi:hypothetical protein
MAMRKEPTMKLYNLMWVLALAGAAAACDNWIDQPPITNEPQPPTGGTGGNGGTGGTGGVAAGACTDEANQAVYAELEFVNSKGQASSGTAAASAIGSECVRGSSSSVPPVTGCGPQTLDVVACFPNCPQPTIDALATCVEECTAGTIEEITGSTLSEACVECYGATVACGAAFCTGQCVADTTAQICIDCRCDNDCTPNFVICSGIPSTDC